LREGGGHSLREGGGHSLREGGGRSLRRRLFVEGRRPFINVVGRKICVGKFKIQHDPMMSEFERT